mmetsp:Transcript_249/g.502  ORF Transcript_249/g.502 Transcript_249/m.502 type:complete len:312 (+) Transcript_249:610-1545(+)
MRRHLKRVVASLESSGSSSVSDMGRAALEKSVMPSLSSRVLEARRSSLEPAKVSGERSLGKSGTSNMAACLSRKMLRSRMVRLMTRTGSSSSTAFFSCSSTNLSSGSERSSASLSMSGAVKARRRASSRVAAILGLSSTHSASSACGRRLLPALALSTTRAASYSAHCDGLQRTSLIRSARSTATSMASATALAASPPLACSASSLVSSTSRSSQSCIAARSVLTSASSGKGTLKMLSMARMLSVCATRAASRSLTTVASVMAARSSALERRARRRNSRARLPRVMRCMYGTTCSRVRLRSSSRMRCSLAR